MNARPGRRLAAPPMVWVAGAATLMVVLDLGRRILATNDEARFPLVAQDILSRGAWYFPQLNGVVYHNKPLLFAWLVALCSWPAGHVTQLTAVLPSALAGIGTACVVYALGRDMFGSRAGWFAALVVVSTQGWFLHARLSMPDMVMTFFVTTSLAMFWPMVRRRPGPYWVGFYGSIGAAFWVKGPAGLIALVPALAYAVATRQPGRWRALHLPAGLALVALLVAPWVLVKYLTDIAALEYVVVTDNLQWYLPQSARAVLAGPPPHVFGILFPWVLALPAVVVRAVRCLRGSGEERPAALVLILWSVVLLVCVGISDQQRFRYYLPLVPPVALLIGWWGARAVCDRGPERRIRWAVWGGALGALVLAAVLVVGIHGVPRVRVSVPASSVEVFIMTGGLVVMIGALIHGAWRNRLARAFVVAWVGSAVWVTGWYHWELERRNAANDYPRVGVETRRMLPEDPVVGAWGVSELPLSFYFDRRVVALTTDGDLRRVMSQHPRGSAVLTESALAQVADRGGLRVLPLQRIASDPVVLVTHGLAAAPAAVRP